MSDSKAKNEVPVICIDGPSGAGKGTVAKIVAKELGWHLLDSGALYRLLALCAQNHGVELSNEEALTVLAEHMDVQFLANKDEAETQIILEGESVTRDIRTETVGRSASKVAALPQVRQSLLRRQHAFREAPGLVADGRDMGTVVFPDAKVKIFLTASAEERAQRRFKQLKAKGFDANLGALFDDIKARDAADQSRSIAPLVPADDAFVLDTTDLSIEEAAKQVLARLDPSSA